MNRINLAGEVLTAPTYSHECKGEVFYSFDIKAFRKSGAFDVIKCIAAEIFSKNITEGSLINVFGEIRTRNVKDEQEKSHMQIFVFVLELNEYDGDINSVQIEGTLCKPTSIRSTPTGRDIADLLIASNRISMHKSDYLPCVAWGRNALRASEMVVGNKLKAVGRLQSRNYTKALPSGEYEVKTAYEVSIGIIEEVY